MKKFRLVLAVLFALALMASAASAAFAADSTDVKYYQNQDATWGQGVLDSVASEVGCKNQSSVDVSLKGKGFGAVNTVPCVGVLGVGQVDFTGNLTLTNTNGFYTQVTKQYSLAGSTEMNQLGGLSSASSGTLCFGGGAGSTACLNQTQSLNLSATVALPLGSASHSFSASQTAKIGGGSF